MTTDQQVLLIQDVSLIDGTGQDPQCGVHVLVEGEKIKAVGAQVVAPKGARIIRADGATLMPGIIDCHIHATYRARDMRQHLLNTPTYNVLKSIDIMRQTLLCGVTTARDMGGADVGFRRAVEEGLIDGPRLMVAIIMISQTGGHGDSWVPAGLRIQKRAWLPAPVADGVDDVRRLVRHVLMAGADFVKICSTGGITSVTDSWDEPQFTVEELRVAVHEAAARKKGVAVHAEGCEGILLALQAQVHSIEHGWFMNEQAMLSMVKQGTWWVPTLALVPLSLEERQKNVVWDKQQLADEDLKEKQIFELMKKQIPIWKEAVRKGVRVAFGTDQSHRLLVGQNLMEFRFMVDWLGMAPMQAIVSATSQAAACIGRDDLGIIAPGKLADLLMVRANPLDNIRCLEDPANIPLIMQAGVIKKGEDLVQL